jgi:hypothetical protein
MPVKLISLIQIYPGLGSAQEPLVEKTNGGVSRRFYKPLHLFYIILQLKTFTVVDT